ncbi:MAG: HDIG domain-containing protein [Candidatus Marinimicrobia bacterium]|nr:HDIG domain-containing protein [Candidatus Neomarinimicrobiota bacterium]
MLSQQQSSALLEEYAKGAIWSKHCFAVAQAALRVGSVLNEFRSIDLEFLWSAALLHDIGRYRTHDPIKHGVEGYHLLTKLGHHQEAFVCASHILFGLDAAEAELAGLPARDFIPNSIEEQLIPLVDFMIEFDEPTTLDERFASLRKRNSNNSYFMDRLDRAEHTAKALLVRLNREIGQSIEGIVASNKDRIDADLN